MHALLSDTLPDSCYFRFNPEVPANAQGSLDETALPKLRELQAIGRQYVRHGAGKEGCLALARLLAAGGPAQRLRSWPARLLSRLGGKLAAARSRL